MVEGAWPARDSFGGQRLELRVAGDALPAELPIEVRLPRVLRTDVLRLPLPKPDWDF